eukprot:scaffold3875_cov75-Phaeocystis_antarctica.AAC.2
MGLSYSVAIAASYAVIEARALLGVGAFELAVGVVVGRSVRERQGAHVVAVLGLEGDEQLVLELARLRASRERGPRAAHRNVGQGRQVREAACKVIVLLVVTCAVGLVVRAHVEHTLIGRVDGGPSNRPEPVVKRGARHGSVQCDLLTAHHGGWADRDLQGAKVTTTSLCTGSRKEGVMVRKKLAAKFDLSVYSSPSIDMAGRTPAVSLRLKEDKPTFTDEN